MNKNNPVERLINGIVKENPTLVLMLGMCPTLAVTTSAINGAGMGLTTTAVLMFSNMIISLLRNFIPDRVRIPAYVVIIASLVTIVQFVLQAYLPELNESLGVYIPLIVVNCIILGRAESYASKNGPINSFFDGVGMGLGFTVSLTILILLYTDHNFHSCTGCLLRIVLSGCHSEQSKEPQTEGSRTACSFIRMWRLCKL